MLRTSCSVRALLLLLSFSAALHWGPGWRRAERSRAVPTCSCPPLTPSCALGIHVEVPDSPEERECGDGTSFPESPDMKNVGICPFRSPPPRPVKTQRSTGIVVDDVLIGNNAGRVALCCPFLFCTSKVC